MQGGDKKASAVAIVKGSEYSIMLDNGSRDSNYISERVAEEIGGARYQQKLRVVTGDGKVSELTEFICLLIEIKLKEEIRFSKHLKFLFSQIFQ
jgi:hypothetical protein